MPTTTSAPAVRRRRTAADRCRTDFVGGIRCVTSLAPIMITQTSGAGSEFARTSVTCRSRSSDCAPGSATLRSRTGRSATAASPCAISAPGVWRARCTPCPAAVESPSIVKRSGGEPSANALPYSPSAPGGSTDTPPILLLPTCRFASRTSASTRPTAAAPTKPTPPPPYAAPAAIRRATLALDMDRSHRLPAQWSHTSTACPVGRGSQSPTPPVLPPVTTPVDARRPLGNRSTTAHPWVGPRSAGIAPSPPSLRTGLRIPLRLTAIPWRIRRSGDQRCISTIR